MPFYKNFTGEVLILICLKRPHQRWQQVQLPRHLFARQPNALAPLPQQTPRGIQFIVRRLIHAGVTVWRHHRYMHSYMRDTLQIAGKDSLKPKHSSLANHDRQIYRRDESPARAMPAFAH